MFNIYIFHFYIYYNLTAVNVARLPAYACKAREATSKIVSKNRYLLITYSSVSL